MRDRSFVALQHVLPQRWLTERAGTLARAQAGRWTTALIRRFIARYRVDMTEAAISDPAAYASFNDFFTRALRPDARVQADAPWTCPVDGALSACGAISEGQIFQAKGHRYSALALLGGDAARAAAYRQGLFATLYLSPRDYHRIHMPAAGRLERMVYVPGALFSVNPATARGVPGLFARNERVVCHFVGAQGPWVLVLVGATIVGSMATRWHGVVNPPRRRSLSAWDYPAAQAPQLAQGDEMGRFLLGSTVVLLLPAGAGTFKPDWQPGVPVRLGQAMLS